MFKMQYMPQMFSQWLFTNGVKLYCSVARFITSASYPQNKMYAHERSSLTADQPLLKKLAWPNRWKSQLLSSNLLANYPFHT